jgi:hypothetical protein
MICEILINKQELAVFLAEGVLAYLLKNENRYQFLTCSHHQRCHNSHQKMGFVIIMQDIIRDDKVKFIEEDSYGNKDSKVRNSVSAAC